MTITETGIRCLYKAIMVLQFFLSVWLLVAISPHSADRSINTTVILTEYILVCGFDYLCDPNSVKWLDSAPKPQGYSHIISCPSCSCNIDRCFFESNCCPDILFQYPEMSCIDLSLSNEASGDVVLMVASCPPDTTSEMNQACSEGDNGNKITNVPVSTPSDNVIFRNKYCASCHGHESNFTKWTFNIECDSIVDINHLSSYDEIYQTGLDNMCRMTYHTSNKNSFISCSSGHTTFPGFKGCNMTGQWATYETSIDWACRNIMAPYRGFNNIFCFACNPDKQSDRTIISGCNVTGMWDPYDSDLEKACLQYPYSQIAYPFKNRFCYLCNRGNDILSTFMDADSSLSLEVWEIHKVNAYEGKLRIDSLQHEKQFHVNLSAESTASLSPDRFNADVNVSKLLSHHFLHYGYHGFCPDKPADLDHTNQQCSCSLTCLNTTSCCAEFALNAPLTYVNEFKHSLSVSKCYGKNSVLSKSTVQERCETIQPLKGFYKIPVRSLASGILYSNIYCFLCNEGQKTRNDSEIEPDYNPLDLKIKCNYTFQTERYIFLEDMLNDFDRMSYDDGAEHCTVSTVYDLYVDNELISDTINRCNVTGHWDLYDSDIEWACLNYIREITGDSYNGFYQNMFCEMCNTASDSGFKYTTCNATNSSISDYCEKYPHITSMKPFKNIFCKICNYIPLLSLPPLLSDSMTNCDSNGIYLRSEIEDVMFDLPRFFTSTVREIFFFSMAPEFPDQIKNAFKMYGNRCTENEIYDKEKNSCILQECADGKLLREEKCVPLLQFTTSLGYTLMLRITGHVTTFDEVVVENMLSDIESLVYNVIEAVLTTLPEIITSYMSTPLQCRNRIEAGERINITITHYTSFYIKKVVNRFDLESKLIKLTNSTITRPSNTSEIEIAIETHSSALELPGKIVMLDFESNCFRVKQREFEYNRNAYRLKLVSKLLLCPRVKLSNDRFEIDESSRRMTLLPHGPVLPFGNYEILANSTVSVCVEDFVAMMDGRTFEKEDQNLLSTILSIVSFVFTCLSLLCLVITFLTYCFFPELRTLPGKNNMCLIFSLFVSQCLTQFGMMRTEHTVPCMIIAVFLHFFWLSAFFSMNICSFHMFRVFVFPLKEARRNHRWTCFWYICYVFGMSALIVIVYISLSVVVFESDNLGYTGNGKCFLSSFESVIVTFISPVVVVCVSNVIFFAVVAFKISTAPKVPSNKSIRQEFPLYVKLFVLTGATWILQILDAFMPLSVFSIISGILNSSQGIFIFLSYSTNGRVRKFYKERLSSTRSTSISNKREFSAIPKTTSCQNDEKTVTDSSL